MFAMPDTILYHATPLRRLMYRLYILTLPKGHRPLPIDDGRGMSCTLGDELIERRRWKITADHKPFNWYLLCKQRESTITQLEAELHEAQMQLAAYREQQKCAKA